MTYDISLYHLATSKGFPKDIAAACHSAVATKESLWEHLATNRDLAPEVWHKIYTSKHCRAAMAESLVARVLNPAQRQCVIAHEKRKRVLRTFVEYNLLTNDEQHALAKVTNAGESLLEQPWLDRSLRKPVALQSKGRVLLEEISVGRLGDFTDNEIETLLVTYLSWIKTNRTAWAGRESRTWDCQVLRIMFNRRPAVLANMLNIIIPFWANTTVIDTTVGAYVLGLEMLTAIAGTVTLTTDQAEAVSALLDSYGNFTTFGDKRSELAGFTKAYDTCLLTLLTNPRCPKPIIQHLVAKTQNGPSRRDDVKELGVEALKRNVIRQPYREINDKDDLDRLLEYAYAYHIPGSAIRVRHGWIVAETGKEFELLELSLNPHLNAEQASKTMTYLTGKLGKMLLVQYADEIKKLRPAQWRDQPTEVEYVGGRGTQFPHSRSETESKEIGEMLNLAVETLGANQDHWNAVVTLLEDYTGTFPELLKTVTLL